VGHRVSGHKKAESSPTKGQAVVDKKNWILIKQESGVNLVGLSLNILLHFAMLPTIFHHTNSGSFVTPSRNTNLDSEGQRIPRPSNAFMLFRKEKVGRYKGRGMKQADISRILGHSWQDLSPEERQRYVDQAQQEKLAHKAAYPDWKFAPERKKRDGKANKKRNGKSSHLIDSSGDYSSSSSDINQMPDTPAFSIHPRTGQEGFFFFQSYNGTEKITEVPLCYLDPVQNDFGTFDNTIAPQSYVCILILIL